MVSKWFVVSDVSEANKWKKFDETFVLPPEAKHFRICIINATENSAYLSKASLRLGAAKQSSPVLAETDPSATSVIFAHYQNMVHSSNRQNRNGTITFPIPGLYRQQIPLSFEIRTEPVDALINYRIFKREDAINWLCEASLKPDKRDVNVTWESLVLVPGQEKATTLPKAEISDIVSEASNGVSGASNKVSGGCDKVSGASNRVSAASSKFSGTRKLGAGASDKVSEASKREDGTSDMKQWLRSNGCIQSDDSGIRAKAKELSEGASDLESYARKVIAFTSANRGTGAKFDSLDAKKALVAGGSCTSRANLAAALFRANGIAARTISHLPAWSPSLFEHCTRIMAGWLLNQHLVNFSQPPTSW